MYLSMGFWGSDVTPCWPASSANAGCRGHHLPRLSSDLWMPKIYGHSVFMMKFRELVFMAACLPVLASLNVAEEVSILLLDISMMQHTSAVSSQAAFGH